MIDLDPRTTPARDDLAAQALEGVVRASRFVKPQAVQCVAPAASLLARPDASALQDDQILFGEAFDVYERRDGYAWGQARRDGYVGWVAESALTDQVIAPTHRVAALRAYAFPEPDLKSGPPVLLTMNALVTVEAREGRFARVARAGWVGEHQLGDMLGFETDPAEVAERYVGAPYRWGGRESLGLDCSGLVQQALHACGRACPRDADMQERELGRAVDEAERRRGDLVFWKDHVAVLLDAERVVHANGWHMAVAVEPLAEAVARNGRPTAFKRV